MTKNEIKQRVDAAIDRRAEEIIRLGEQIRLHPELGFKEVKTAGHDRRARRGGRARW